MDTLDDVVGTVYENVAKLTKRLAPDATYGCSDPDPDVYDDWNC